jgi:hypothetical protein
MITAFIPTLNHAPSAPPHSGSPLPLFSASCPTSTAPFSSTGIRPPPILATSVILTRNVWPQLCPRAATTHPVSSHQGTHWDSQSTSSRLRGPTRQRKFCPGKNLPRKHFNCMANLVISCFSLLNCLTSMTHRVRMTSSALVGYLMMTMASFIDTRPQLCSRSSDHHTDTLTLTSIKQ